MGMGCGRERGPGRKGKVIAMDGLLGPIVSELREEILSLWVFKPGEEALSQLIDYVGAYYHAICTHSVSKFSMEISTTESYVLGLF